MQVGDLVRHVDECRGLLWVGMVIKQIPGTAEYQGIRWLKDNSYQSVPKKLLKVVSHAG
jgi:hypothetical protein